jgi:predicted DsbA family dithiol-disulfide isomerase
VAVVWKSFPLAVEERQAGPPSPKGHDSRRRAAVEEPAGGFEDWPADAPHPRTSMPALIAGKCAAKQGKDAFDRFHEAAFDALFDDCRDISSRDVILDLAAGAGLDIPSFTEALDESWGEEAVFVDFAEARRDFDGWGIPLAVVGGRYPLVGAVPVEMYRRAVDLCLAGAT